MPISATRRMMTGGGWATPSFDIKDPVSYVPLWRPDMVAKGGSIVNGTGTMNVSPQALAIGANTITVTAAGTLIISIPEGGTVASGTMTVTGSPVTVSPGIATTITTTGAIGNITVTPSNIIRSKDKNNYALTLTGTTWGFQGMTLNGTSGLINIDPVLTPLASTTTGTWEILASISDTTPAAVSQLISFSNTSGALDTIRVYVDTDGTIVSLCYLAGALQWAFDTDSTTLLIANKQSHIVLIHNGTTPSMMIDGTSPAVTFTSSVNKTRWFSALTNLDNGRIGSRNSQGLGDGQFLGGTVGEARFYNRNLNTGEVLRNYQSAIWRYS